MITDQKLKLHSILFFKNFKGFDQTPIDFEAKAFIYIKQNSDFQYKDKVNGDTLVMILEDKGFLKYERGTNRMHSITNEGIEFLNKKI